jgi:flagellar assembly protein FliH
MNTSGQTDMTAGSHKKYLFDKDFGQEEENSIVVKRGKKEEPRAQVDEHPFGEEPLTAEPVEEAPPPPPTYSQEDLDRAREEGRKAGRDEATRDMASAIEQRLADTLAAIDGRITTLFSAYEQDKEEHNRDAVGVATVIVRKLFPALNMDKAMTEIEHMIVEAMKRTSSTHTLIVRVPEDMLPQVQDKVTQLASLRGREGALNVIADETMSLGDVAVEWEGGGMVRDIQLIWREIDEIIERNLGQKPGLSADFEAEPEANAPTSPKLEPNRASGPDNAPNLASKTEQEVVNTAQVGENEEKLVESPNNGGDATDSHEPGDLEHQNKPQSSDPED